MKKIVLISAALCLAAILITGLAYAGGHRDSKIGKKKVVPSESPSCFVNDPRNFPAVAKDDAPVVVVAPSTDAQAIYSVFPHLTKDQRLSLFNALDGKTMTKVWLIHFASYRADHDLTPQQEALIDKVIAVVKNVDLKEFKPKSDSFRAAFIPQAAELFGKKEAWELFYHLGGPEPAASNVQQFRYTAPTIANFSTRKCDCFRSDMVVSDGGCFNSEMLSGGYRCASDPGPFGCDGVTIGCGFMWICPCDGVCVLN